jgi:hypothetical protein
MRRFRFAFVSSVLVALSGLPFALTGTSAAQEAGVWVHPSGAYSLNYGAIGWKLGKPYTYGGRTTLVTFEPPGSGYRTRHCLIFEGMVPDLGPGSDQETANRQMTAYTADAWGAGLGLDPARIHYHSNEANGPVQVASIGGEATRGKHMLLHYRTFVIVTSAGGIHQELSCSVTPSARQAYKDEVNTLLASLTIASLAAGP